LRLQEKEDEIKEINAKTIKEDKLINDYEKKLKKQERNYSKLKTEYESAKDSISEDKTEEYIKRRQIEVDYDKLTVDYEEMRRKLWRYQRAERRYSSRDLKSRTNNETLAVSKGKEKIEDDNEVEDDKIKFDANVLVHLQKVLQDIFTNPENDNSKKYLSREEKRKIKSNIFC